jgi:hypothetical protein
VQPDTVGQQAQTAVQPSGEKPFWKIW